MQIFRTNFVFLYKKSAREGHFKKYTIIKIAC